MIAAFPLTPALSLGERVNRSRCLDYSSAGLTKRGIGRTVNGTNCERRWLSPLPKGEGQGEGKGHERKHGMAVW